eukprot:TRINITY_DN22323_c0_g1_i1.p1 TRINITY_DN22323_c0_g1~~TRINITY_DN22323_c0_g1_i1.p1  ORF type:complete len:214 (+),score=48.60 TRINITY_DN22323_c0_g1_i1:63-704(+)
MLRSAMRGMTAGRRFGWGALAAPAPRAPMQKRGMLLAPAAQIQNHRKMLATYTMRSSAMSSHMHVTVLFSVKGASTVVVAPCAATLWTFVTNGSGVAPRYTNITTAVMLPVTRAASMAGGTVIVVFVSQVFCVVTVLTGVGCVQLTQVASAWQRRACQAVGTGYSIKPYMITGTMFIKVTQLQPMQKVHRAGTFDGGTDARNAVMSAIFRKTF